MTSRATSPYGPIRMRENFWWSYMRHLVDTRWIQADGRVGAGLMPRLARELVSPAIEARAKQIEAEGNPEDAALTEYAARLYELRHWIPLTGQFEGCGRQIFDVQDNLTQLLLNTDLGDVTLEGLQLPFDCFYVYFGRQESLRAYWDSTSFEYVDGVYIGCTPFENERGERSPIPRFRFGLTMCLADGTPVTMPSYFLDIHPDEARLPLPQAIDKALARRVTDLQPSPEDSESLQNLGNARVEFVEESADLVRQAMPLILNSLFYLESLPKLPAPTVGRDTSPEMTAKWMQSTESRKHKVKSTLTAAGYTLVYPIGQEFAKQEMPGSTGGTVATHWRRGFRRNQRHGPGNTLVKRVWIRPVLVNANDTPVEEIPGHVYVAPEPGRSSRPQ